MTNQQVEELCLALLHADSGDDAIRILDDHNLWNTPQAWRLYGNVENNYSQVGNQQGRSDAALVEKLTNAIDARLMCECLSRGVDPESSAAPRTIREAVSRFFENRELHGEVGGTLSEWHSKRRLEVSQQITVALTGTKARPCVTIADIGEGQAPSRFAETFLSLSSSNKLKIPFVQGKFNMGGTGVLEFCGEHNLQLIISRRCPAVISAMHETNPSQNAWGFTVVRREDPPGNVKNSIYTYLAPAGSERNPRRGEVYSFQSPQLLAMPDKADAYSRTMMHGSVVKLYDYDMKGYTSHACLPDGLLYRLDARMPEPALPIRIHECRKTFRGKQGSFDTTLAGLAVRLDENRAGNLEAGFPDSVPFKVRGEHMIARVYAFRDGRADTYRTNEGVIFTVNGQTHGVLPKTIFGRKRVNMSRLASSLLVLVDCSSISTRAREKLFMTSRDRLRDVDFRKSLEETIESILSSHPGLRELRDSRKSQEIESRLEDSKPLEEVLDTIIKASPSLTSLFQFGSRLSRPHKPTSERGSDDDQNDGSDPFVGKIHPTYFRFAKTKSDFLKRTFEQGRSCRLDFETDVVSDYFKRATSPGRFRLEVEGDVEEDQIDWHLTLHDGRAHLSLQIAEDLPIGSEVTVQSTVEDENLLDPFVNVAQLIVQPQAERPSGDPKPPKARSAARVTPGNGPPHKGLSLPEIRKVHESDENWRKQNFNRFTSCTVVADADPNDDSRQVYTFYVNVDNWHLLSEMKRAKDDPRLLRAKFIFGNVLIGLALLHDLGKRCNSEVQGDPAIPIEEGQIPEFVRQATEAIAPFLIPMINQLGSLSSEDVEALGQIGDDE